MRKYLLLLYVKEIAEEYIMTRDLSEVYKEKIWGKDESGEHICISATAQILECLVSFQFQPKFTASSYILRRD